jgi:hypothetical protein
MGDLIPGYLPKKYYKFECTTLESWPTLVRLDIIGIKGIKCIDDNLVRDVRLCEAKTELYLC